MDYKHRAIFISENSSNTIKDSEKIIAPSVVDSSSDPTDSTFYTSVRKAQEEYDDSDKIRLWGYITELDGVLEDIDQKRNEIKSLDFVGDSTIFNGKYESTIDAEFTGTPYPEAIDEVLSVLGFDDARDAQYTVDQEKLTVQIRWTQKYDSYEVEKVSPTG